jgi:hypothetical protein
MNTFCVYRVHYSKTHMFVLSAGFCRQIIDWSVYSAFMLTADDNPKGPFIDLPHTVTPGLVNNQ